MISSGATLRGLERLAVFNRLRAAAGLRWELPPLLRAVVIPAGSRQPGARVDYVRVDAKTLPFRTERFDVVLSLYVLHHAQGYRAALAEMARVLKPGGHALILDLMRPTFVPQVPASVAPEGILTESEWRELFRSCGFAIARWQVRYLLGPLPRCSVVARVTGRT